MTAYTLYNGHIIKWNNKTKKWHYKDGKLATEFRKCPKCGKLPTNKGHDACLSNLPGIKNACCGHGVEDGYLEFEDGTYLRFKMIELKRG